MVGRLVSPAPHTFPVLFCSLRQKWDPLLRPLPALQHMKQMGCMENDSPGFCCFYFHLLPGSSCFICGHYYAGSPRPKFCPGVSKELQSLDGDRGEVGEGEMRHYHLAVLKNNTS